jgi:hypothetical protein
MSRHLIYLPEINSTTFLFFYAKGDSGRSYSFRDYTVSSGVRVTYAHSYPYTADQIVAMAKYDFDAPAHDTNDMQFWHDRILALNRRYLAGATGASPQTAKPPAVPTFEPTPTATALRSSGRTGSIKLDPQSALAPNLSQNAYPVLALEELLAHPVKGSKSHDLERIFSSRRSEDWVTWNVVKLLSLIPATMWWPAILELAREDNPNLSVSADADDLPKVKPWVRVPSPPEYEKHSRTRMAQSGNPDWVIRTQDGRPVEGTSEIDIVLWMPKQVGFVEAKLDADISKATTYDPQRNQIARNVDCLLEVAAGRVPFFWMLTADRGPGRAYTQLIERYRNHPDILASELPHRSPSVIHAVARNMSIILWKDVLRIVRSEHERIWSELDARTGFAS